MIYTHINIPVTDSPIRELLIAILCENSYEGFEEKDDSLNAFIPQSNFDENVLKKIIEAQQLSYSVAEIPKTNWNKEWEENFHPVVVENICTVRADFHNIEIHTPYEIIITPKMSFGTGHHATTQLMMQMMDKIDFKNKTIFDFGTGTGILAILAELLGANSVLAIDNDEWSVENAVENAEKNKTQSTKIVLGSIENISEKEFDIILANINRHILIESMKNIYKKTKYNGIVLMSGLLVQDKEIIQNCARENGFHLNRELELNNWIALQFMKK